MRLMQELIFLRLEHGLGSIEDAQLFKNLVDVDLDGLFADAQVIRDDFVGMALCNQIKNLQLPLRQPILFGLVVVSRRDIVSVMHEQGFELARDEFGGPVFGEK